MRTLRFAGIALFIGAVFCLMTAGGHSNFLPTTALAADQAVAAIKPIGKPITIKAPLGLPPVPIPADNPPTADTIALGRLLYYDPVLSSDNTISCSSCHSPDTGFTDRGSVSTGVGGKKGVRHSPTVINSAYNDLQFWDGRAPSLEEQAKGPIINPVEMATTHQVVVARLQADPKYVTLFKQAWGTDRITIDLVVKSIATFERTVLCGDSPFDRYYYAHDENAISDAAQRGLKLFTDPKKGNCAACHTIGEKYALFTDNKFHNLGVGADIHGELNDLGRYDQTKKDADYGAFKTPTLRNIAQRAPYFHDGSFPTLKDALGHYVGGGNANPHLDKEIHELDFLSFDERDDILAFLNSLTTSMPANLGPPADFAKLEKKGATKR